MISVLAGGVGAARMLRGLCSVVAPRDLIAVVNTGDDTDLHGLAISPDLDTIVYTLAGAIDPERGWGLVDETWRALGALSRYAPVRPDRSTAATTWFNLGDQDLATHMYRTARRREGGRPCDVAAEIARAWGVEIGIVPMTDDPVATRLRLADDVVVDGSRWSAGDWIAFQEYFVRLRHSVRVSDVMFDGADTATPNALDTLRESDAVVIAPSNPIVSIGPIRALPGVDDALRSRRDSVVAVSPIVAGSALKGPADRLLTELGMEASVVGVARVYCDVAATLVIDRADAHLAGAVEAVGMACVVTDTVMRDADVAASLARATLAAAGLDTGAAG